MKKEEKRNEVFFFFFCRNEGKEGKEGKGKDLGMRFGGIFGVEVREDERRVGEVRGWFP